MIFPWSYIDKVFYWLKTLLAWYSNPMYIYWFIPSSGRVDTIWMHYMDANLVDGEKAWR